MGLRRRVRGPTAQRLRGDAQSGLRDRSAAISVFTGSRRALQTLQAGRLCPSLEVCREREANGHVDTCWASGQPAQAPRSWPGVYRPPSGPLHSHRQGGVTGRVGAGPTRGRWGLLCGLGLTAVTPKGWGFLKKDKILRQNPKPAPGTVALASVPDAASAEPGHRAHGQAAAAAGGRVPEPAGPPPRAAGPPPPGAGGSPAAPQPPVRSARLGPREPSRARRRRGERLHQPNFGRRRAPAPGRGRDGGGAPGRPAPLRAPGHPARGLRAASARAPGAAARPPRRPRPLAHPAPTAPARSRTRPFWATWGPVLRRVNRKGTNPRGLK